MSPDLAFALALGAVVGFVIGLLVSAAANEAERRDQDARDLAARMSRRAVRRLGDE